MYVLQIVVLGYDNMLFSLSTKETVYYSVKYEYIHDTALTVSLNGVCFFKRFNIGDIN